MHLDPNVMTEMIDLCQVLNKRLYEKDRVNAERVEKMLSTIKNSSEKNIDKPSKGLFKLLATVKPKGRE